MKFSFGISLAALAYTSFGAPYRGHESSCKTSLSLVYQFPNNGSWIENLAVRPNGLILGTRIDVPELYSIDPDAHTASLVRSFAAPIASLLGITEVKKDFYAIVGMNQTFAFTGEKQTGYVITADFTKTPPVFKRAAAIRDSLFLNGVAPFSKDVVLVSDSGNGVLYRVDLTTGSYSIAASDPLLGRPGGTFPAGGFGANGLKIHGRFAYFTSSTRGVFGRVPLSHNGYASGPAQTIATTGTFLDDFSVTAADVAYVATNLNDTVLRITPDGDVQTVAGKYNTLAVAGATSLVFKPGSKQRVAYVGTEGSQTNPVNGVTIEPAKIVKLTLGPGCYH